MSNSLKLSDGVSLRLIQIFQEAIMTGVDGADLLRQVRLQIDSDNETLVLTSDYQNFVNESYRKLEAQAAELQNSRSNTTRLVIENGNS